MLMTRTAYFLLLALISPALSEESHWAFLPISQSEMSVVHGEATNPIDHFIKTKLQAKDLTPAPQASKRTLIRRVHFDLIGLPPAPQEVAAFVNNAVSFEELVDQLLVSPLYGERWGRHWLDLARYGDSNGGDENHAYPNAYHYRNWVIKALNDDLPYNAFLTHQLAGDLLQSPTPESITATGFLALGTKILAEQDPVKKQADIVDEQIDTFSRALLGLTVACARCHDHKFDPVSQRDYYALAGIFHSTAIENGKGLETERETQARKEAKVELARIETSITKHTGSTLLIDREAEDFDRGNVAIDTEQYGKDIGIISDPGGQLNFAEYDFNANEAGPLLLQIRYAAAQARPGRILLDGKPVITPALEQVTGGWGPEHQAWSIEGILSVTSGPHTLRIESEPMLSHLDKLKLHQLKNAEDAQTLIDQRQALKIAAKKGPSKNVMSVRDGTIAHAKLNRRGNPHDLGDEVPRGMVERLGTHHPSPSDTTSGRLELAEWLVSPNHPLTSRVLVNRIWRWHFGGQTLVASPDDFGTRGSEPTHPALLDYLAHKFTQDGWSLKNLHKMIVMSRTWQRSGHHPNAASMNKIDPENTLYWKHTTHRLEAEAFRDAILTASGQLNPKAPTSAPPQVKSQDPSPEDLRKNREVYEGYPHRSVYLPIVRSHLYDLLTLLDFPNATSPVGERNNTTVPTQALLMLNNPWLTKQAKHLADRVDRDLDQVYQHLYSRSPSLEEIASNETFLQTYTRRKNEDDAWTALCQTLMISNEFLYIR